MAVQLAAKKRKLVHVYMDAMASSEGGSLSKSAWPDRAKNNRKNANKSRVENAYRSYGLETQEVQA